MKTGSLIRQKKLYDLARPPRAESPNVVFVHPIDDDAHRLDLPARDWELMGSPTTITVTIEPGNTMGES